MYSPRATPLTKVNCVDATNRIGACSSRGQDMYRTETMPSKIMLYSCHSFKPPQALFVFLSANVRYRKFGMSSSEIVDSHNVRHSTPSTRTIYKFTHSEKEINQKTTYKHLRLMSTHVPIVFGSQHKIRMGRHESSVRRRRKPKFSRVNFLVRHSADNVTSAETSGRSCGKLVYSVFR